MYIKAFQQKQVICFFFSKIAKAKNKKFKSI